MERPIDEEIGGRMRKVREQRGLSVAVAAELLGTDKSRLSQQERGIRPISRALVRKAAEQYGVSVSHLELGLPQAVHVLFVEGRPVVALADQGQAEEWASTMKATGKDGVRVHRVAVDDEETLRGLAEMPAASTDKKEVLA